MSSNYPTIQQHEPLRVPSGWGAQEKRLIAQLEEILDDLYSRFNRLKLSDMGKALQATIKDTERITLAVEQSMDEDGNITTLKNSTLEIDTDGIEMKTSGAFRVYAKDNDNSYIKFGGADAENPNFSLGEGGIVKAKKVIADEYESSGNGLVTALTGSMASKMIVSTTEPQNVHDVIWLQPAGTGGTVDFVLSNTDGTSMNGETPLAETAPLVLNGSAISGATSYEYGVKFLAYNYEGTCVGPTIDIWAKYNGSRVAHLYHGTISGRVGVGSYFSVDTLDNPSMPSDYSSVDLTQYSSLVMEIQISKSAATKARFEKYVDFVIRCKATGASSSGVQACTVKYIP